jgi:hypothetical protein
MEKYICKECGMAVIILDSGEQLRPCGHKGTILLDMKVVCKGISNTKLVPVTPFTPKG